MKKLFSLISLLGVGATPLVATVSCGSKSADSDSSTFQFENGLTQIEITGGSYQVTIDNWPDFSTCSFEITTSGSTINSSGVVDKTKVPFTVEGDGPDGNGTINLIQNGLGKGEIKIVASRDGNVIGTINANVISKPGFDFDKFKGVQFNADENGKFPNENDKQYKEQEFSLKNYKSLAEFYDIKFSSEKKYSDGQSPFGEDKKEEPVSSSSLFKSLDDGTAIFDLSKIKQSGSSFFSITATIKEKIKNDFDKNFGQDNIDEIKSDKINIIAIGHGQQVFNDPSDTKISAGDSSTTGAMGNFNNVNLYDFNKTYNATIKSDASIGQKETVAMLVPTSFFKGSKETNIGVSASKLTLKNSSKVNVSVFYKSGFTVEKTGDVDFKDNQDNTLTIWSTGNNAGTITLKSKDGSISQKIAVSRNDTLTDNLLENPIAPIVDLTNATSSVSTNSQASSDTWDLTKATYVKLDVLSSLMNGESEFYAFYSQVDSGTDFNFDIISKGAKENTKFLTTVLSGQFDMTKLLVTQGSGSSASANTYQQFIDSIANLYFTTYTKK